MKAIPGISREYISILDEERFSILTKSLYYIHATISQYVNKRYFAYVVDGNRKQRQYNDWVSTTLIIE